MDHGKSTGTMRIQTPLPLIRILAEFVRGAMEDEDLLHKVQVHI